MSDILVLGDGYLGTRFARFYGERAKVSTVDITDLAKLEAVIMEKQPKVVINAAAMTLTAEAEKPERQRETFLVNVEGPAHLMMLAMKHGFRLVHLGTGMIYDGGPHAEDDMPTPTCYYAWTKAWADAAIAPYLEATKSLILRLHMPYSSEAHPRNLLNKLQSFTAFADVPTTMTRVEDLLEVCDKLLEGAHSGVYHLASPGPITVLDIAKKMKAHGLLPAELELKAMSREQLDALTEAHGSARQSHPVLSVEKLERAGIRLKSGEESVEECLAALAH